MKWIQQLRQRPLTWLLRVSAAWGFVALVLMIWGIVDPAPIPVILSMSLAQVIGGVAFFFYVVAVASDTLWAASRRSSKPNS